MDTTLWIVACIICLMLGFLAGCRWTRFIIEFRCKQNPDLYNAFMDDLDKMKEEQNAYKKDVE